MTKYTMRGDFVLVRIETVTSNALGIALPGTSEASKRFWVEEAGSEVKDLKEGDEVILSVDVRTECVHGVPGDNVRVVVRQSNISAKVARETSQ